MVNTRQFSGLTYMQDMTKSHTFSAKNQGSTYTPRNTVFKVKTLYIIIIITIIIITIIIIIITIIISSSSSSIISIII